MKAWVADHPIARKAHRCETCSRTIERGEQYLRSVGLGDGTAYTWKECAHCEALRTVRPDIVWDEEYDSDTFFCYEPTDWMGMVWKMRWQHNWRHGNGDLCAIPTNTA